MGGAQTSATTAERPTSVRWLVFALACAASWLLYLHRYAWGVVKPEVMAENPQLDPVSIGWLDSAFHITYAVGQMPGGLAGDVLGPRGVLAGMALVWSAMLAVLAWSRGFVPLFAARAVFGLAQAGTYPVLSQVTRRWFPAAVRTSVQGTVAAFGRVGGACSSLLLATVLMGWLGLSWQTSLVVLSVPGLVLAAAVWAVLRSGPGDHPACNDAERALIEGDAPARRPGARAALHLGPAAVVTLAALLTYSFCSTFADQFFVYWLPTYLREGKLLTREQMGFYNMLPLLGGAAGGIVGGMLNDALLPRAGRRLARSGVAFAGKAVAAALVLGAVGVEDGRAAAVVLGAGKFFNDWSLSTQWGAITDVAGPASGTVFGIVNTVGTLGGLVGNPVLGWVLVRHGWSGVLACVAAVFLTAALLWILIDSNARLVADRPAAARED